MMAKRRNETIIFHLGIETRSEGKWTGEREEASEKITVHLLLMLLLLLFGVVVVVVMMMMMMMVVAKREAMCCAFCLKYVHVHVNEYIRSMNTKKKSEGKGTPDPFGGQEKKLERG